MQSWILLLDTSERVVYGERWKELTSLCAFWCWFGALVAYGVAGGWAEKLGFVLLSHALAGLLHVQITLSHFPMTVYHDAPYKDEQVRRPLAPDHRAPPAAPAAPASAVAPAHRASSPPQGKDGWLRTQLATTLDVDCPPWLDWLHGGLQFQVAHHVFPRVPRHNLREVHQDRC